MSKITGLGKGLGSLIPKKISAGLFSDRHRDILAVPEASRVLQIPVENIRANPQQPRQVFSHEGMEELVESIKTHGIIQPLIVSALPGGEFELIAGERRLRAARILGLATVPVILRAAAEQEKLELALIENVQRENLNPIEKAAAYQRLLAEFNLTQEAVAEKLGQSRSTVANTLRFLDLPEKVQQALVEGQITEGHAKIIAGLKDEKSQVDFLEKILQYKFNVRDAAAESKNIIKSVRVQRRARDPMVEEQEDLLRRALNTKVSIKKHGERGQIVIDFYSDEELAAILTRIVK